MAHTKAQRAVRGNRDSRSKRRGVKRYGGERVIPGNIIIRQKGTVYWAGDGTYLARDFTIHANKEGVVQFKRLAGKQYVCVIPSPAT